MKKRFLLGCLGLAMVLAACGGGGGTPVPAQTVQPKPQNYTLQLHWVPASSVGLAAALRRPMAVAMDTSTAGSIVVQSANGGTSGWDTNGDPAYVTVSISPQPSPGTQVTITANAPNVVVQPTPSASPNPSASPGAIIAPSAPNVAGSGTVTATAAGSSTTQPLLMIKSLTMVAPSSGSPVPPDAIGFSFDSNCNAVPQTMTAAADVYITYTGETSAVYFPAGGVALKHGRDVSTLTVGDWSNAYTSIGINAFGNAFDDTLVFKTSTGRIAYIAAYELGGAYGTGSAGATFQGGYACLN